MRLILCEKHGEEGEEEVVDPSDVDRRRGIEQVFRRPEWGISIFCVRGMSEREESEGTAGGR